MQLGFVRFHSNFVFHKLNEAILKGIPTAFPRAFPGTSQGIRLALLIFVLTEIPKGIPRRRGIPRGSLGGMCTVQGRRVHRKKAISTEGGLVTQRVASSHRGRASSHRGGRGLFTPRERERGLFPPRGGGGGGGPFPTEGPLPERSLFQRPRGEAKSQERMHQEDVSPKGGVHQEGSVQSVRRHTWYFSTFVHLHTNASVGPVERDLVKAIGSSHCGSSFFCLYLSMFVQDRNCLEISFSVTTNSDGLRRLDRSTMSATVERSLIDHWKAVCP